MKKTNKIIVALCILFTMITVSVTSFGVTDIITQLDGTSNVNVEGVTNIGNSVIKIVRTAGIAVAIVVLLVLGIKYITGSAEEKASYKKTMIPYIIGAILIAASTTILTYIIQAAESL